MIEINLLPEDLRVKAKAKAGWGALGKVKEGKGSPLPYIAAGIIGILACVHFYLAVNLFTKSAELAILNRGWTELEPQKKVLEDFKKEHSATGQDESLIQGLISQRIFWAEKLNKLSLSLPSGVWFNDITMDGNSLVIQGSVVSLRNEELILINKFIENLKTDKTFFDNFSNLELNSVQKKSIGSFTVSDFLLTAALKTK